jgi:DNA-binding NarL/FixJ family response regulator
MKKEITVLIADDDRGFSEALKMLIKGMGTVTVCGQATNGEEAVLMAGKLMPDVILMDVNMAPVNGFEATRKIIQQNPAARIIGFSLHNKVSYARNMMRLGARGYVCKSSPHMEIVEAIRAVSAGKNYIDPNLP